MIQRFRRLLSLALLVGLIVATLSPVNAATSTPPMLSQAFLRTGDGTGIWKTWTGWGYFHLYFYDDSGTLLNNADETISLPLKVGSQTFTFFGDYYPYNPIRGSYANRVWLGLNGASEPSLSIDDTAGPPNPLWPAAVTSTTIDGYIVTVTSFSFTQRTTINKVSPYSPTPGGWYDSTGSFTIDVQRALPTNKGECTDGGWESFGVFKNQGDCVSYVATKGKKLPANW